MLTKRCIIDSIINDRGTPFVGRPTRKRVKIPCGAAAVFGEPERMMSLVPLDREDLLKGDDP